jgi:IS30 family transposase
MSDFGTASNLKTFHKNARIFTARFDTSSLNPCSTIILLYRYPVLNIYFAHPYRSWERGLNEHTNGLIRRYLPKKIPFDTPTQKQLDKIVDKINNRPRKVLGYLTPYEVFSP